MKSCTDVNARPLAVVCAVLSALLVCCFVVALCLGAYGVSIPDTARILFAQVVPTERDWAKMAETVVVEVRLPRVLAALLVGAALAVAGGAYQSLFRNPLVSPDLLGV